MVNFYNVLNKLRRHTLNLARVAKVFERSRPLDLDSRRI